MRTVLLEGDLKVRKIDEVGKLLGERFLVGYLNTIYPR